MPQQRNANSAAAFGKISKISMVSDFIEASRNLKKVLFLAIKMQKNLKPSAIIHQVLI
jgi:hypothetical protein